MGNALRQHPAVALSSPRTRLGGRGDGEGGRHPFRSTTAGISGSRPVAGAPLRTHSSSREGRRIGTRVMSGQQGPTTKASSWSSARPHLRHDTPEFRRKREAYEERVEFLQEEARHEGYALNPASHRDFEHFALGSDNVRMGGLVLLENGNLRAIWRDEQGTRLGLQFLGGGRVQYVIFKRRKEERLVSRAAGRDSLKGLERQLAAFDMRALVYE